MPIVILGGVMDAIFALMPNITYRLRDSPGCHYSYALIYLRDAIAASLSPLDFSPCCPKNVLLPSPPKRSRRRRSRANSASGVPSHWPLYRYDAGASRPRLSLVFNTAAGHAIGTLILRCRVIITFYFRRRLYENYISTHIACCFSTSYLTPPKCQLVCVLGGQKASSLLWHVRLSFSLALRFRRRCCQIDGRATRFFAAAQLKTITPPPYMTGHLQVANA